MAIGPFARILAQIVVPVVAVLARAIPAAYGQAAGEHLPLTALVRAHRHSRPCHH